MEEMGNVVGGGGGGMYVMERWEYGVREIGLRSDEGGMSDLRVGSAGM